MNVKTSLTLEVRGDEGMFDFEGFEPNKGERASNRRERA